MNKPIYEDPVVAEVHAIRKALLDECDGDMDEYRRRTLDRQASSGHQIITSPLKQHTEKADAREPE